jgi:RHS repeat-associated protein
MDSSSKHADSTDARTSWLRLSGNCMLEKAPDGSLKDIITDGKGSVVATGDASGLNARGYTAYGYAPSGDSAQSTLGYNGEYTDPVTGNYHLGNGYRAFSPALMRFTAPDSLSPFGAGGLNTYAYCAGDPINAIDPTGHMPWWELSVLGLSTLFAVITPIFDVGEAVAAFGAIAKFAEIAQGAEEGSVVATTAARLASLSKFRVGWHGILAIKGVGSAVLQVGMDYEGVLKKKSFTSDSFMKGAGIAQGVLFGAELLGLGLGKYWLSGRALYLENELSLGRDGVELPILRRAGRSAREISESSFSDSESEISVRTVPSYGAAHEIPAMPGVSEPPHYENPPRYEERPGEGPPRYEEPMSIGGRGSLEHVAAPPPRGDGFAWPPARSPSDPGGLSHTAGLENRNRAPRTGRRSSDFVGSNPRLIF